MNTKLQAKLATLPNRPGVYFHKDASGEIIYVGKAAILKNRVRQYFQDSRSRDNKSMALVAEIVDTDWVETESEIDALFLESEMVKRYKPRYNVLLRDDKSQLFVRINLKHEWPTVTFTRNPSGDGAEYFGPFYNGYELKKALRYLRRVFPYFVREPSSRDSQLEAQIGLNPDVRDGSEAYKQQLRKLISYIKGNRTALMRELEDEMKHAAREQRFEAAARARNRLRALKELSQRIMFGDQEFLDISKDKALVSLVSILGLSSDLRRIEGYDISHHGGQNVVASMVVFTNGVSDRGEYRKFKMARQTNDDTGNMYETLLRRLSPKNITSWGTPDLLLIDGGKGQLRAVIRAQAERQTTIPVISIAKRNEELLVALSGSNVSIEAIRQLQAQPPDGVAVLDDGDFLSINLHVGRQNAGSHSRNLRGGGGVSPFEDVILLFQRVRDESHRFAVSYHSTLQRTKQTASVLDTISGVGPKTRQKLLRKFGSVAGIRRASIDELAAVVGSAKATHIHAQLGEQLVQ